MDTAALIGNLARPQASYPPTSVEKAMTPGGVSSELSTEKFSFAGKTSHEPGPIATTSVALRKPTSNFATKCYNAGAKMVKNLANAVDPLLTSIDINLLAKLDAEVYELLCTLEHTRETFLHNAEGTTPAMGPLLQRMAVAAKKTEAIEEAHVLHNISRLFDLEMTLYCFKQYEKIARERKGRQLSNRFYDQIRLLALATTTVEEQTDQSLDTYRQRRRSIVKKLRFFLIPFSPDHAGARDSQQVEKSKKTTEQMFHMLLWLKNWVESDISDKFREIHGAIPNTEEQL